MVVFCPFPMTLSVTLSVPDLGLATWFSPLAFLTFLLLFWFRFCLHLTTYWDFSSLTTKLNPGPSVVRTRNPNHWITRESLGLDFLSLSFYWSKLCLKSQPKAPGSSWHLGKMKAKAENRIRLSVPWTSFPHSFFYSCASFSPCFGLSPCSYFKWLSHRQPLHFKMSPYFSCFAGKLFLLGLLPYANLLSFNNKISCFPQIFRNLRIKFPERPNHCISSCLICHLGRLPTAKSAWGFFFFFFFFFLFFFFNFILFLNFT